MARGDAFVSEIDAFVEAIEVQIMRWSGMRVLTQFLNGHHPGPDGAISKLYWSEFHREVTELGVDTMRAVAFAQRGSNPAKRHSFIVTEELAPTISLEDFCRDWP